MLLFGRAEVTSTGRCGPWATTSTGPAARSRRTPPRGRVPVAREPVRLRPGFRAGLAGTLACIVLAAGLVAIRAGDGGGHRVDAGPPASGGPAVSEGLSVTKSDAAPCPTAAWRSTTATARCCCRSPGASWPGARP